VSSKHSDIQRATQPVTLWLGLAFHGQEFTCLDGLLSIRVLYSDKFIHCTGSTMLSLNTQSSEHACVHGQWDMLICCWKEGHCLVSMYDCTWIANTHNNRQKSCLLSNAIEAM